MVKIEYGLQVYNPYSDDRPAFYWTTPKRKEFDTYENCLKFLASYACAISFRIIKE